MLHYLNGRRLEVPIAAEGTIDAAAIRHIAQVPANLMLILERADGTRFVVDPQPGVRVNLDYCRNLPLLVLGYQSKT